MVPDVFFEMCCQNLWLIGLSRHLAVGLSNTLRARDVVFAKVFKGGPLLRWWAGAVLK